MLGENKSHNLMPLVAFFIAVHTSIVLFQSHVAQYLASWGMAPCPPHLNPPLSVRNLMQRFTNSDRGHRIFFLSAPRTRPFRHDVKSVLPQLITNETARLNCIVMYSRANSRRSLETKSPISYFAKWQTANQTKTKA